MTEDVSLALIGECMIELRETHGESVTRGYGGDVLNTAIYLARLMRNKADIRFTTLLGDDPFSAEMVSEWKREGILCDTVGYLAGHNAGLYFVTTNKTGERSFHYWRNQSAARHIMSAHFSALLESAMSSNWIYISGITLAILNEDDDREHLLNDLEQAKSNGSHIIFDGNFRPSLWRNKRSAKDWHTRAWRVCNIALAGAEDEAGLFGDMTEKESLKRLKSYEIPEICLKNGPHPLLLSTGPETHVVEIEPITDILDTTAAGDSFNAGYIAARLQNKSPIQAAQSAAILAGEVIRHPGAIIPQRHMPKGL